jgi:hypothetical protein
MQAVSESPNSFGRLLPVSANHYRPLAATKAEKSIMPMKNRVPDPSGIMRLMLFSSSAAEYQRKVISRHVDDLFQFHAMIGGGFFQIGDVLQAPFRHLV